MSKPFAFAILVGLFISPKHGNAQFFDVTWGASMDAIAKSMGHEMLTRSDSTIEGTLSPYDWQSLRDFPEVFNRISEPGSEPVSNLSRIDFVSYPY